MIDLPKYQCHKVVSAAKIASAEHVDGNTFHLGLALPGGAIGIEQYKHAGAPTNAWALVGWYLVRYDNGYESVSPAKAFEEGYDIIEAKPAAFAKPKKVTP